MMVTSLVGPPKGLEKIRKQDIKDTNKCTLQYVVQYLNVHFVTVKEITATDDIPQSDQKASCSIRTLFSIMPYVTSEPSAHTVLYNQYFLEKINK